MDISMMQVAMRFERVRRQNNAKNDKVVLYKAQMYNVYILNALNKPFQLGNIAQEWIENSVI